jgi:hypothetical protein
MEEIIARLFDLLGAVSCTGVLTDAEEKALAEIERDYSLAKETTHIIKCPCCGKEVKF